MFGCCACVRSSAEALYKFFDKIFPGEVFTVEIALDIAELDAMNAKRKRVSKSISLFHFIALSPFPLFVLPRC